MKTGNTARRNYRAAKQAVPQWSPVMKTGNTWSDRHRVDVRRLASMEPGHEDREYMVRPSPCGRQTTGLNGARS